MNTPVGRIEFGPAESGRRVISEPGAHIRVELMATTAARIAELEQTIRALRIDLWNIAGTVRAACDSGDELIAAMACLEGSPLVDSARDAIFRHGLSNETTLPVQTKGGSDAAPPIVTGDEGDR